MTDLIDETSITSTDQKADSNPNDHVIECNNEEDQQSKTVKLSENPIKTNSIGPDDIDLSEQLKNNPELAQNKNDVEVAYNRCCHNPKCSKNNLICICVTISIVVALLCVFGLSLGLGIGLKKTNVNDSRSCDGSGIQKLTLFSLTSTPSSNFTFYYFAYNAMSKSDRLTLSFKTQTSWYLDELSVIDTSTGLELIKDGGFESGSFSNFELCPSANSYYQVTNATKYIGTYAGEVRSNDDTLKLSKVLDTTKGQVCVVSLWLMSANYEASDEFSLFIVSSAYSIIVSKFYMMSMTVSFFHLSI